MAVAVRQQSARGATYGPRYYTRTLAVIAHAEFKLKYAGSALGYIWSILKPLLLFLMLYAVFGHVFKLGTLSPYYPLLLLMGIVLFYFFQDATTLGMYSLVTRETLLRKLSFPRLIIPIAATLTAAITFGANLTVILAFVGWKRLTPQLDWLLIPPLLLELYAFTLGIALILATLFIRLRDLGQVWELAVQVFFYASPIIYPVGYLPPWARKIAFVNPFTQVLQDIRAIVVYPDTSSNTITAGNALAGYGGRTLPVLVALASLALGVVFLKREEPWFAERA